MVLYYIFGNGVLKRVCKEAFPANFFLGKMAFCNHMRRVLTGKSIIFMMMFVKVPIL